MGLTLGLDGIHRSERRRRERIVSRIEDEYPSLVEDWIKEADPSLPLILTAHASVEGAMFGAERMVMLGTDLVLPTSLVKDQPSRLCGNGTYPQAAGC